MSDERRFGLKCGELGPGRHEFVLASDYDRLLLREQGMSDYIYEVWMMDRKEHQKEAERIDELGVYIKMANPDEWELIPWHLVWRVIYRKRGTGDRA